MKRLTVLVSYDFENIIDDYVLFLANECRKISDRFVVVINGYLSNEQKRRLETVSADIIQRNNVGYDGGAYKEVLLHYLGEEEVCKYDELILVNDSFYGPFFSWDVIVNEMDKKDVDYWGLIRSDQEGDFACGLTSHVNSYFISLRKQILLDQGFWCFWRNLPCSEGHDEAVRDYEMGLNSFLQKGKYLKTTWLDSCGGNELIAKKSNPYVDELEELITKYRCPILKRKAIILKNWREVKRACNYIVNHTDYDVDMIWNNWRRYDEHHRLESFSVFELIDFCKSFKKIYLYGKGIIGEKIMDFLNVERLDCKACYVVTNNKGDISVRQIDEVENDKDHGIVIAVGKNLHDEVYSLAKKYFTEKQIFRLY